MAGLALALLTAACATAQASADTPPARPTPTPRVEARATAPPGRPLPAIYLNTDRRAIARGLATWTGRAPADYDATIAYEAAGEPFGGTFKLSARGGKYLGFEPVDDRARQWLQQAGKSPAARVAAEIGIEALFEKAAALYDYAGARALGTAIYDPIYGYPSYLQLQLVKDDRLVFRAHVIQFVETGAPVRSLIAAR